MNYSLIKKHEGLRLEAYLPTPNDRWTIGWGHTKTARPGMKITEEQAEELFQSDIAWVEKAIEDYVEVELNDNQYDALASFVYNLGAGNFRSSTLLKKLNSGDYEGAANEFPRWNKQRNKKTGQLEELRGLTKRRAEERELFLRTPTIQKEEKAPESPLWRLLGLILKAVVNGRRN
jgi:GH24 family phage-related lysozyme (muramidase)